MLSKNQVQKYHRRYVSNKINKNESVYQKNVVTLRYNLYIVTYLSTLAINVVGKSDGTGAKTVTTPVKYGEYVTDIIV